MKTPHPKKRRDPSEPTISDNIRQFMGPQLHNQLLRELGGKKIFIPRTCGAHHPLAEILGHAEALKLCREFAGQTFEVPLTQRIRERIIADLKAEVHVAVIAARYYCSRRTVFRVKAELAQWGELQGQQGRLF